MQIVLKLSLVLLVLVFSFCSKERDLPRIIIPEATNITVVNSKVMLRNQVPLLAVNFIGDTTIQKNRYVIAEQNFIKQYNDTFATTKKLKVVIDTSYSFYSKHFVFRVLKNPTSEEMLKYRNDIYNLPYVRSEDSLRNVFVASYPILVYNDDVTEQKLSGESYEGLVMIQEAIDSDGRWKPIEFRFWNGCSTGLRNFKILPKRYIASAIIKYTGEFSTKIRVKLVSGGNVYYSNVINGKINRSQFNQDFIENFLKERGAYEQTYFEQDKQRMLLNFSN